MFVFCCLCCSAFSATPYSLICSGGTPFLNLYTLKCIDRDICSGETNVTQYTSSGNICISQNGCVTDDGWVLIDSKCYPRKPANINNPDPKDLCEISSFHDMESCEAAANNYAADYFRSNGWISDSPGSSQRTELIDSIQFSRSYEIIMDQTIDTKFSFSSILTFILARYALNGTFLGFKEVELDLTRCHEKNDISQIWRLFGTNYYSTCNFNYLVMKDSEPDIFYNMFLLETAAANQQNLIPIPVLVRNYGNNGRADQSQYKLFKRFFMKTGNLKFPKNVTINIQIDITNARRMKLPLLIIDYVTVSNTAEVNYSNINFESSTSPMHSFSFSVVYTRDMSSFWKQSMIVMIVFMVLSVILWIVRSVIYAKHHKDDGTTLPFFFAFFCSSVGTALALVTFICTFFLVFVFFKWQKSGFFCLPPENEFWFISVIVWVAFSLMFLSSIILIFLQTRANVFIVDWEQPFEKGVSVSAWRRLMVANEFNRILSIRSYSLNFSLILLLFILEGFNLTLLASPVPRAELVDVGKTYKVLHFAFTAFLWLILMLLEYCLNILIWKIIGNPFLNFIDLCATANCSVLIMGTQSQGFYIHGRSVHDHTDVDMAKLNDNLVTESNGNIGLRGLMANSNDQVFHVYLEKDFSYSFRELYSGILQTFSKKAIETSKAQNYKSRAEVEAMAAFSSLNRYLCKFFEGGEAERRYDVQQSTFAENFLGWGPQISENSVLTIQGDYSYRETLLIGIEWTLNIMYLLLFAGIEMETKSPAFASFAVFIVDLIFMKFYRRRARLNLARKAILDKHYIVS